MSSKRLLDRSLGSLLLALSMPLLALLALALSARVPGKLLAGLETVGRRGLVFRRLVFDVRAPARRRLLLRLAGGDHAVARALVRLPQLVHVLSGRMSLVGPQPHQFGRAAFLRNRLEEYTDRLELAPGLVTVCWLAPPGCNQSTRLVFEREYRRRACARLDLAILGWALREAWGRLRRRLDREVLSR